MLKLYMLVIMNCGLAAVTVAAGAAVLVRRRPDWTQPVFVALGVLTVIGTAVGWIISMR
ncbi:hypothetical protein [Streptomyces virginiae]|uniref:hypothetical protein n=1 Tax=Streptomyces virginiae TaxID=1961 RepID=UPI0022519047|nr:hypothetical protein [Streptomyces virginiae]MCX5178359.1 hypothetical protein [Streptomyces virginiae]